MNKFLLLLGLSFSLFSFSQTIIFEDSFETYPDFTITNFGDWVMYDVDNAATWGVPECNYPHEGDPMSSIIFNPSQCTDDQMGAFDPSACNYSTITGDKYVTFWCAQNGNNDYLVSPQIDLTNMSSASLSLQAKELANASQGFSNEHFEILVSTAGNTIADLTNTVADTTLANNCMWYEFNYDLSAFAGQQIYIAIHHITDLNGYALHIDDFKVTGSNTANIANIDTLSVKIFPNPASNSIHIESETILNTIKITNTIGQIILIKKINQLADIIDLSNLKSGVYFITFENDSSKKSSTMKFVKK